MMANQEDAGQDDDDNAALRRDLEKGVASVEAGRISRASADDIIAKAKARKRSV